MNLWLRLALILLVGPAWTACAQRPGAQASQEKANAIRLAIVAEGGATKTVADLLTAELSKKDSIQLLERNEIEKVYREQGVSAANNDYLKLGQILGANGLLLVQSPKEAESGELAIRLIAVGPGVFIREARASLPASDAGQWAEWIASYFQPLFPKLRVTAQEAVPVSVVNLRSALRSADAQELERQLTLLTIERLTREQGVFVLERRRMELLSEEKELAELPGSAFWSGSYLFDGVLDRDGYSKDTLTLNAKLTPPKGAAAESMEIRGSRTNLAEVAEQLVTAILTKLKLHRAVGAWNAAEEAVKYFEEGKWAYRWNMLPEAAAACETSWALGKRSKEVAELRIRSYSENGVDTAATHYELRRRLVSFAPGIRAVPGQMTLPPEPTYGAGVPPEANKFHQLRRAMDLYRQDFQTLIASDPNPGSEWHDLGLDLLENASYWLRHYYFLPEARVGEEDAITAVQELARELAALMSKHPAFNNRFDLPSVNSAKVNWGQAPAVPTMRTRNNLPTIKALGGIYWTRTPEQGLEVYREILNAGFMPKLRHLFLEQDLMERMPQDSVVGGQAKLEPLSYLVGWKWEDRKRALRVWHQFIEELCASTNQLTRLEGLFLGCAHARTDTDHDRSFRELIQWLEQHRDLARSDALRASLVQDVERLLKPKAREGFQQSACEARRELWMRWQQTSNQVPAANTAGNTRLESMTAYLAGDNYEFSTFLRLFLHGNYQPAEARALLPLVSGYRSNLTERLATVERELAELEPKRRQSPKDYVPRFGQLNIKAMQLRQSGPQIDQLEQILRSKLNAVPSVAVSAQPAAHPAAPANLPLTRSPGPNARPPLEASTVPAFQAGQVLEVTRFWRVPDALVGSNVTAFPAMADFCYRDGRLWVETRFDRLAAASGQETALNRGKMFSVEPDSFQTEIIDLPSTFALAPAMPEGRAGRSWEIFDGSLYLSSADALKRYSLKDKTWTDLPVPVHGHARLQVINRRLLASTDDAILEISSAGNGARVLASARRQPPLTLLDSMPSYGIPPVVQGPGGSLLTLIGSKIFEQSAGGADWTQLASHRELSQPHCPASDGGALVLNGGADGSQQISALFAGTRSLELLLVRPGRPMRSMGVGDPRNPSEALRPKWTWPKHVPPAEYGLCLEGQSLWLYAGSLGPNAAAARVSVPRPSENPQGLLLNFRPGQQSPLEVPVRLQLPAGVKPRSSLLLGGREKGLLEMTPQALAIASTTSPGFWLIPRTDLLAQQKTAPGPMPPGASANMPATPSNAGLGNRAQN